MSAALKIVPNVITHAWGASQALDRIAEERKHALKLVPLPCERCGRTECDRESSMRTYDAALTGDADEGTCEALWVRALLADDLCIPVASMEFRPAPVIPEHDIELDPEGYCATDALDRAYDLAREREKEGRR